MPIPAQLTLPKDIVAIQIEPSTDGSRSYGLLSCLPQGTELIISGDGFNHRTAKVLCNGKLYFVFLRDLESAD
jgi:hypothetical protein